MNGLIIQHSTCPACRIQRTVRRGFSGTSVCMNCGEQWGANASVRPARALSCFTRSELTRLEHYRRAIAAGLYSDWP